METSRKPVAVFISNLRTLSDMADLYPPEMHESVRQARDGVGYISSPPFDIQGVATGYLVLMLRSGEEVIKSQADSAKKVMDMTRFAAEELDGDVIGLGSLTTSITHGGEMVVEHIASHGWKMRATHGDTGSVVAIRQCLDLVSVRPEETIAVVGAYGVIGSCLTRLLSKEGHRLVLCGPRKDKLDALVGRIVADGGAGPAVTTSIGDACAGAGCIITVTSHPSALLSPDMVKPRAVIIDPAVPANTRANPEWSDADHRNLVVSNASQVRIPGVGMRSCSFGTFDDPDDCPTSYACFAETLLNAVCHDREHHVGEIAEDFVGTVSRRFRQSGFVHAAPRMYGSHIGAELANRPR